MARRLQRLLSKIEPDTVIACQKGVVEIPVPVLSSLETLDELQDWLTAQNPQLIAELQEARRQDVAGVFKPWQPRHVQWPTHVSPFAC